jgi:hypothetical protein
MTITEETNEPQVTVLDSDAAAIAHEKLTGLRVYTRSYWDAQKHRIKISNRAFSGVTDNETIKDIKQSAKRTEDLLSKALVANFKEEFSEIFQWVSETTGLGPVLMGRLLGEIGHPVWAFPSHWEGSGETRTLVSDPPYMRNVAKLWAYCGHGDPNRKVQKRVEIVIEDYKTALRLPQEILVPVATEEGNVEHYEWKYANKLDENDVLIVPISGFELKNGALVPELVSFYHQILTDGTDALDEGSEPSFLYAYIQGVGLKSVTDKEVYAMGNRKAKMLVHLLAESCMKLPGGNGRSRSPYRDTYDAYRAKYEDRVDVNGKPWPDGRKHNAALRVVGKEILLDLWVLAQETLAQAANEDQVDNVLGHEEREIQTGSA